MTPNKSHSEFSAIDMNAGWSLPVGYAPGAALEKILSGALNEVARQGTRTRLLRLMPGMFTTTPFTHDYWEEVFLVAGDLYVGNDARGQGGVQFIPFTYACRPPGVAHGPFKTDGGCLLLEIHYYP